jgi:hypothetical protein
MGRYPFIETCATNLVSIKRIFGVRVKTLDK